MAAALLGKTEIKIQDTSQSTTVPDNPIARLMYYFDCICSCVEADDSYTIRRLRDYKNYASLTSDEEAQVLVICLALSPDKLIGKVIFPSDDCGNSSNRFLKLSAVSTKMVVAESLVVGGQSKKIQSIMMFEKAWIERNYLDPLRSIQRRQRQLQPPPKKESSCIIS